MSSRISGERIHNSSKHKDVRQDRQHRLEQRSSFPRHKIDRDSDALLGRRSATKTAETVGAHQRLKDRKFITLPPQLQDLIVQVTTEAKPVYAPLAPAEADLSTSREALQPQRELPPVTNGGVTPATAVPVEESAVPAQDSNDKVLPAQSTPAVAAAQPGALPSSVTKSPTVAENRLPNNVTAEPPGRTQLAAYEEAPKARSVRLRDLLTKADNGSSTSSPLAVFAKNLAQRSVEREEARQAEAAQMAKAIATDPAKTLAAQANHNKSSVQVLLSERQGVASSVARAPVVLVPRL